VKYGGLVLRSSKIEWGRITACPPLAGYKVLTGTAVAVGIYETLKK